jgi:PAS domain S-box-containing protein
MKTKGKSVQDTEAALARYTSLYDLAPVACFIFERDGTIQQCNVRGTNLLGNTDSQVNRQNFGTFVSGESLVTFHAFLARAFSSGDKQSCEVTLLPNDQRPQIFLLVEAVAEVGGQTCCAAVIDITERKQARLSAQENYALLSRLSAQIPGILFQCRLDPDGTIHFPYVNESAKKLYRGSLGQARDNSMELFSMVHPEDIAELKEVMRKSAADLSPLRHEFRVLRRNHGIVWRAVEANPEMLSDGSILWHGYTLDISERKRVEEELRESEERWKLALEGAGHGVWDWNLQTGGALYSKRWKEILGFAEDDIGNTASEWITRLHPDDMPCIIESQKQILDQKQVSDSIEFRLQCKDGRWKWVLGSGILVSRDAAGDALRMVGTISDIDQRKHTEEALRLALAELEERRREAESLSEAKSRFLNAASHDLRQPLYATRLFADAMGDKSLTQLQQETLRNLRLSVDAMSEQLQLLLEFSRLDMGNIRPKLRKIPIKSLFRSLEVTYAPAAIEAGVQLHFRCGTGHVHSDSILITRLLGNLLDNAIKFAPRGTLLVCARRCSKGGIRFEVRDNGPGIPPEHQQRIFEEYYQIDNPAREAHAGLGLGLSIALRISRLLELPFALQTRVGRGSVFSVTLPIEPPAS